MFDNMLNQNISLLVHGRELVFFLFFFVRLCFDFEKVMQKWGQGLSQCLSHDQVLINW